jgi:V-type H+-transporting ATPase subunit a
MYRIYFRKEKQIYINLNKCIMRENVLDGEVWLPEEKYEYIQNALHLIEKDDQTRVTAQFLDLPLDKKMPPTYFKSNDLIWPFQEIVNTYGIPRYREINPALFAIVTFPFLFGVMFGDIGHGFILLLFSSYLCIYREDIIRNKSPLKAVLKARYILLLMGFFAFYAGWMYNDFLSIPLDLFGSCYENVDGKAIRKDENCIYPWGLDPKWYVASNELAYFNSLKMKLAVILGVSQMTFGIVLRGVNAVYFQSVIDFVCEFIPQIIFMTLLFGYMVAMIFIKWTTNWDQDPSQAPSIITLLMNIFLKAGSVEGKPLWGSEYAIESVHFYFLLLALICIPVLLIPKPILLYMQKHKEEENVKSIQRSASFDADNQVLIKKAKSMAPTKVEHHEESFADIFIHQAIETIEFVLGSISNTASYLRLWALSLAHAQLAKVFFDKCLLGFMQANSLVMVIIGFFIFANVTFFVLMCMDLLECCLHTLRLHWVEFQNKFFKADGHKFTPFNFKYLVEPDS